MKKITTTTLLLFTITFHSFSQCLEYNTDVTIDFWKPAKGGVGRFVKDVIDSKGTGSFLVFLGKDDSRLWLVYGKNDHGWLLLIYNILSFLEKRRQKSFLM